MSVRERALIPPQAVLEVLWQCSAWTTFTGPTGARLWRMPGSDGAVYTVTRGSCTCPWATYHHHTDCKHQLALALYQLVLSDARGRRRSAAPPPPKETPDSVV